MRKRLIIRIAACAIFAALFFVFDLFSIKAGPFKISLSGLPIIIIALMYGPIDAMIVGFCGALLGQLIGFGLTPITILWLLPHVARGFFVGICRKWININDFRKCGKSIIKLSIVIIISSIIVTILNTLVMWLDSVVYDYYSYAYIWGALVPRFATGIVTAVVYSVITPLIIIPIKNLYIFKK